jgi:hypothetical protein
MTLLIQEKQADVQANQARHAANLQARVTEKQQDIAHQRTIAQINTEATLAQERAKLAAKREEMLMQAEQKHRDHLYALEHKRLDHDHKTQQHTMQMALLEAKEREANHRIQNGAGNGSAGANRG